ncbi:hypothetical protein ACFWIW_14005 [Amycolatopsis sp. NPDC058340]|uniref:hypothetical protein n=1 Tax=Amycolatopsis sp. NPDC058340 TaxID=3346453 RepID=UPI003653B782
MAKKDHKVVIHTTDGRSEEKWVSASDAAYYENLPFTSSNVRVVTVTPPKAR